LQRVCHNWKKVHSLKYLINYRAIFFWSWDQAVRGFDYYKQDFDGKKFLTQSTFIPDSTQVVSGTTDGFIVVWDISLIMENYSKPEERRNIKVLFFNLIIIVSQ
jgi:hypothetical protein